MILPALLLTLFPFQNAQAPWRGYGLSASSTETLTRFSKTYDQGQFVQLVGTVRAGQSGGLALSPTGTALAENVRMALAEFWNEAVAATLPPGDVVLLLATDLQTEVAPLTTIAKAGNEVIRDADRWYFREGKLGARPIRFYAIVVTPKQPGQATLTLDAYFEPFQDLGRFSNTGDWVKMGKECEAMVDSSDLRFFLIEEGVKKRLDVTVYSARVKAPIWLKDFDTAVTTKVPSGHTQSFLPLGKGFLVDRDETPNGLDDTYLIPMDQESFDGREFKFSARPRVRLTFPLAKIAGPQDGCE